MKKDSTIRAEALILTAVAMWGSMFIGDRISRAVNAKAASTPPAAVAEISSATDTAYANSPGMSCGEAVVSIAEQALGHPYKLGAPEWNPLELPAPGSKIDCSAFTKWVYNRYAYLNSQPEAYIDFDSEQHLSRTVGWQAENIGRVVDHDPLADWGNYRSVSLDCSRLQKGDLLFFFSENGFGDKPGLVHIGISEGGCRMIHAGAYTMKVDIIEDLRSYVSDEAYYIGAKRVCPDISMDPGGKTDGLAPDSGSLK